MQHQMLTAALITVQSDKPRRSIAPTPDPGSGRSHPDAAPISGTGASSVKSLHRCSVIHVLVRLWAYNTCGLWTPVVVKVA